MRSEDIVNTLGNPSHVGCLGDATHVGRAGSKGDGPYMTFWLAVENELVRKASAESHGCSYAITVANLVAEHIVGKRLSEIVTLSAKSIEILVGGLPEGKGYCADLAANALSSICVWFGDEYLGGR